MIQQIKLQNFRNFSNKTLDFESKNFIYWENGIGKTNILEALSIFDTPLVDLDFSLLIKRWADIMYLELILTNGKKVALSYEATTKKKKYLVNWLSTTKKKLQEIVPKMVSFHPLGMNIMYLGPSKRRDFLDQVLAHSFRDYGKTLKEYKKIVISRNKVLKNISEGKSSLEELDFWNHAFIETSCKIYDYRKKLIRFIQSRIQELKKYFWEKVSNIEFVYTSKVQSSNIRESIIQYLEKNIQRDILLRKTTIWPHVDDFNILLDGSGLVDFASRWEVKSSIIDLKFIEADFRKIHTNKQPLFLIDDLMSELDEKHKNMIFENISDSQTFITSITELSYNWNNIFL